MKYIKYIIAILALLLIANVAFGQTDYSQLSEKELRSEISKHQKEIKELQKHLKKITNVEKKQKQIQKKIEKLNKEFVKISTGQLDSKICKQCGQQSILEARNLYAEKIRKEIEKLQTQINK